MQWVLVEALMVKLALAKTDAIEKHQSFGWRVHFDQANQHWPGTSHLVFQGYYYPGLFAHLYFQRVEGKIFSPMAFTLSFALLGAILLTLTLVPTLLSFAVKYKDLAEQHSGWNAQTSRILS